MTGLNVMAIIGRKKIVFRGSMTIKRRHIRNEAMHLDLACEAITSTDLLVRMN